MKQLKPPRDVEVHAKLMLLLDFAGNRHRIESDCEEFNRYAPPNQAVLKEVSASLFDGVSLKSLNHWDKTTVKLPGPRRADLAILKGYVGNYSGFNHYTFPVFLGHAIFGRAIPGGGDYYPGNLRPAPDPGFFRVSEHTKLDGHPCTVLKVSARAGAFDIWVDPAKESAIVRFVEIMDGNTSADLRIHYRETDKGWLPRQWTWSRFHYFLDGQIDFVEEMNVDRLVLDPPLGASDFTFEEKPGMIVVENVQAKPAAPHGPTKITEATWFRVGPSGQRSEMDAPQASAGAQARNSQRDRSLSWRVAAIGLPALALILLVYNRMKTRKTDAVPPPH